jgi:hypothetical protein
MKEGNNTNLIFDSDDSGYMIKAVTTDGTDMLDEKVEYLKVPEKYIIYGCIEVYNNRRFLSLSRYTYSHT